MEVKEIEETDVVVGCGGGGESRVLEMYCSVMC